MGIRQTLNENPAISLGAAAGVILIALIFIIWELMGGSKPAAPAGTRMAYYSDDNGATWFPDDGTKIPPFDHNGKTAALAIIYKCASGQPFCLYLQQYTPEGKQRLEQLKLSSSSARALGAGALTMTEVKKPGPKSKWVKFTPQTSREFMDIMKPVCPDGSQNGLQSVRPEQP